MNLTKTFVLTCMVSLFVVRPCDVMAVTLNVPSSSFPKIQHAIEHAADGDVINVAPGRYVENLIIENEDALASNLSLRADGEATIKGSITAINTSIEINGFNIVPAKATENGIVLRGAHNSRIANCIIKGFKGTGIMIESGILGAVIEHNAIHRCGTGVGYLPGDVSGTDFAATENYTVEVNYNSIAGNTYNGVNNMNGHELDATSNWWGDSSGPGGVGPGIGDGVTTNVDYTNWDVASEPPRVVITRAYVTDLSYRFTSYKGDTVLFHIEYSVSGGGEYAKHRVKVNVHPYFGEICDEAKKTKTVCSSMFVGQGDHSMILAKKVPWCADDYTYILTQGGHFEMDGNWVDVDFSVILKDPYGNKVDGDISRQPQVFLVKKERE